MVSAAQRKYILFLLFMVSVFNYVDRTILSILQIPIKKELGLTDAQLGMLTGLAFAIFYAVLGVPIGRLADYWQRRRLVAGALTVWTGFTALTGIAASFASLLGFRIGVAVGEAGSIPASHSIISDLYPPDRRATAIAIFGLSLPVGILLGYSSAGWLVTNIGWREAFFVIGLAGLIVVPFMWFAKEPKRGTFDPVEVAKAPAPSTAEALKILWSKRAYRWLVLAGGFHAWAWYSVNSWNAMFYVRVHQVPLPTVSYYLALVNGIGSAIGIYAGARLADYFGTRDVRGRPRVIAISQLIMVPIAIVQYLVPSHVVSMVLGAITMTMMLVYYGPIVAVAHQMMPANIRGFTSGVLTLVVSLIGLGLGPLVTGFLSDKFTAAYGVQGLGYAISVTVCASLVSAFMFWRSSVHLPNEVLNKEPVKEAELPKEPVV
ncbi:MFS transporter [Paraburkholderia steynii]|uniref:MFS transporter n=1 Tax=Paraburkholderia steynii TaxID=1245441 RepID=A0A4R0X7V3_9BURK|nr:MFS transporter [Paraburkholderia steynii]